MRDYLPQIKRSRAKIKRWEAIRFWSITIIGLILFFLAMGIAGRGDIY